MFDFLAHKFSSIFKYVTGKSHLTESNIEQVLEKVKETLIESDVPLHVIDHFITELKQKVMGQKIIGSLKAHEQFMNNVYEHLVHFLGYGTYEQFSVDTPARILVMGLQGSGKTTTIAKLGWHFKQRIFKERAVSILAASVDFYRPAAIDQLEVMSHKAGIDFYRAQALDPVHAAREIGEYAKQQRYSVLLLDTAGRLHIDAPMLQELQSVEKTIQPNKKILVLDAMTGQQSLTIAHAFDQAGGFDGAILTKLDGDTRAGAAFAFCYEIKKPVWFLGTGEKVDELEPFKPDRIARRMIGMGDLHTLAERASEKIRQEEQKKAEKAFLSSKGLSLEDFLQQIQMMNRLGSFSQLVGYLPGAQASQLSPEKIEQVERDMVKFRAIIQSMNPQERANHLLLNNSRKQRIARGAGVQVSDINLLLQRFEQTQQFAKLFKKMGNLSKLFNS